MARKAKEGKIDLYYLNTNKKEEKKARAKNSPSRNKKAKRNNKNENSDTFNFDNEIVIGINVLPDKEKNKSKNKKKSPSKKNTNKKKTNTKNKVEESDKFDFDNEIVIGVNVLPNQKENAKSNEKASNKKNKANNRKKDKKINNKKNIKETQKKDKPIRQYKNIKLILKILLILGLFSGVIVFLVTSPLFNIKIINVTGNNKVSTEQIISFSGLQLENNIYKIVNSQVEEKIKGNAYIDTVSVKRKIPNEINITVTERKPQYLLKYGNAYVYMSSQGYILDITEEKIDLPIISGYTTPEENLKLGNRLNIDDLNRLEVVLKIMESASSNDIAKFVSEINMADENNYTLILESKGKTAYLGSATNINDKIIVLKQMIIKAEGQNGKAFLMDKDKMYFREE